jgi:hypothetical protein
MVGQAHRSGFCILHNHHGGPVLCHSVARVSILQAIKPSSMQVVDKRFGQ